MNLVEIRKNQNLSQTKVAKDLEIPIMTYNNYEKKRNNPSLDMLIKLADYFDVSLDYLCGRQYNNQIGYIPEEKKEVVKLILQLNQINTIKLFGYVSGLLAGQN